MADEGDWRRAFAWTAHEDDVDPELVVEVYRRSLVEAGDPALARWAQRLGEHQAWAARHAGRIADALGLSEPARTMVTVGAALHDEGKRRPEWQRALGMWPDAGDAWAKSGQRRSGDALPSNRRDARSHPASMAGYRHEFGSVRDVGAQAEALAALAQEGAGTDWRDLCLHLIAAHHGHARPTIPAYDPATPPSVAAALACDIALRYARLEAHWGSWGLAWWELLLQAADWQASAELNAVRTEVGHG